ncbi:hypothetical protein KFK09_029261 [Dendrobium nobile]|uniref:J domain-containing protein n=1 Tax=Dendrobium nobile TaxID=94219 RepID=A0A8T3A5R5_DENNO|nr:hypothetical protein KFK09_029261 [Dendrobium nobile]
MECNRDEALRAKEIAERKASEKDYLGAKKIALKAQNLFPSLEGISQMITTLDVYLASEAKINGEKDLYAILQVNASADEETVKKQYRKLALLLHPDKNKFTGAEGAFQLVSEAWNVLSDRSKKMLYDQRIYAKGLQQKVSQPSKTTSAAKPASNGFYQFANCAAAKVTAQKSYTQRAPTTPSPPTHSQMTTFWTSCAGCCMQYEYHRMYLNKSLLCPKCKQPFLATELPIPPSGLRPPKWSSKQYNLGNMNNNTNKNASAPTGMGSAGFQHGVSADSSSATNFQWSPFSGLSATAGADGSSSTVAQAANVVQQAYEKAKRQREEAQAASRREEFLRKRYDAPRRNTSASANLNTGTGADVNVNRRRDISDDAGSNCSGNQMNHSVGTTRNALSEGDKVTGDSLKSRLSSRQATFNREYTHLDVRPILVEKAKLGILKKLSELNSAEAAKGRSKNKQKSKEDIKELKEVDDLLKDTVQSRYADKKVLDSRSNKEVPQKEVQQDNVDDDSDKDLDLPVSIDVPDPDFHDFDNDRTEEAFGGDQIWATYDEDDGMPRYYALIQKVLSTNPFKVRMSFLTSKSNAEFADLDWVSSGFTKTSGEFRVARYEAVDSINIFSHKVKWEKGFRGVIRILPRKGDTWALYRNWTPHWNEHTSDDVIHKYDMVEVLGDYNEDQGISVVSLVKVAGFKTVFKRHFDPKEVKMIPKQEMFRFSHQVPSYVLTGEEADNAPKGCLELDPAATPLELLQASSEAKCEEHINDAEQ